MKLIKFVKRFFLKREKRCDPFSEAIAEGIKDSFREMGYKIGIKDKT